MLVRAGLLAVLVVVAGGLAARRARLLTRLVRLGRPVQRGGDVPRRVARETASRSSASASCSNARSPA